jgi:hypothetical protein
MKQVSKLVCGLMVLAVIGVGCEKPAATTVPQATSSTEAANSTDSAKKDEHGHDHGADAHHHGAGPNGGVIVDLGKDHAEFTVDHAAKTCSILFLDGENEKAKPLAVAAKELILTTKETKTAEGKVVPVMTITLTAQDEKDGKASKFTGTDPGLELVADHAGTIIGEVDGKPAQGEFKEE